MSYEFPAAPPSPTAPEAPSLHVFPSRGDEAEVEEASARLPHEGDVVHALCAVFMLALAALVVVSGL